MLNLNYIDIIASVNDKYNPVFCSVAIPTFSFREKNTKDNILTNIDKIAKVIFMTICRSFTKNKQ